jgi:TolB protein
MKTPRLLLILSLPLAGLLQGTPTHAADPPDVPVVDVLVDVNRSLPRVWILPADEASKGEAESLAKVLALAGLYAPAVGKVGQKESGLSVEVKSTASADGTSLEALSTQPSKKQTRRLAQIASATRSLDLARLVDAVILDLSGERSHLSGRILFTDTSAPGHRVVRASQATGDNERAISPPDAFARGADFGPGGLVYYAMSRPGLALALFVEGRTEPVPLKVSDHIEMVSISPQADRMAVVTGARGGSAVWQGPLLGDLTRVSTQEMALEPSYGARGQLAYVAGPANGPLRVVVGDRAVSPPGLWASSPSFCAHGATDRVAYGGTDGVIRFTDPGGATSPVIRGQSPVCSPDGRAILFSREGRDAGLYIVGLDGISPRKIRGGSGSNLRWAPGGPLPPEG